MLELAIEAAYGKAVVAGSVGPLGGFLEPYGDRAIADAENMSAELMTALVNANLDIVLIEKMVPLSEVLVAVRTAKNVGTEIIRVTMTFESTPEGPKTLFGETEYNVVVSPENEAISFMGSNCGSDFDLKRVNANEFCVTTKSPLLVQMFGG